MYRRREALAILFLLVCAASVNSKVDSCAPIADPAACNSVDECTFDIMLGLAGECRTKECFDVTGRIDCNDNPVCEYDENYLTCIDLGANESEINCRSFQRQDCDNFAPRCSYYDFANGCFEVSTAPCWLFDASSCPRDRCLLTNSVVCEEIPRETTLAPTSESLSPSASPTYISISPSMSPTSSPSTHPSTMPTLTPSLIPSIAPSLDCSAYVEPSECDGVEECQFDYDLNTPFGECRITVCRDYHYDIVGCLASGLECSYNSTYSACHSEGDEVPCSFLPAVNCPLDRCSTLPGFDGFEECGEKVFTQAPTVLPTLIPTELTTSRSPSPAPPCNNVEGWYAFNNPFIDCEIALELLGCDGYPWSDSSANISANEACCECGGGVLESYSPSSLPTNEPTALPSMTPSSYPSQSPSLPVSNAPTTMPIEHPTSHPSAQPSEKPSTIPTNLPTLLPSMAPITATTTATTTPTTTGTTSATTSRTTSVTTTASTTVTTTEQRTGWLCPCSQGGAGPAFGIPSEACKEIVMDRCVPFPFTNNALSRHAESGLSVFVNSMTGEHAIYRDSTCSNNTITVSSGNESTSIEINSVDLTPNVCTSLFYFFYPTQLTNQLYSLSIWLSESCIHLPDGTGCPNSRAPTASPSDTSTATTTPAYTCAMIGCNNNFLDFSAPCQCDHFCEVVNDCCTDYIDVCLSTSTPTVRTHEPTSSPSSNPTQIPTNLPSKSPTAMPTMQTTTTISISTDRESPVLQNCHTAGCGATVVGFGSSACSCSYDCVSLGDCCDDFNAVCVAPFTRPPTFTLRPSTSPTQIPTFNPTNSAPSNSPSSSTPTTMNPTTATPTTAVPTTSAPTTSNPTTALPTTAIPTTELPTTINPTPAPSTISPTTSAPSTSAPTTSSPTTQSPTTSNPTTFMPTRAPTFAPTTNLPTTSLPTRAPTTLQPTASPTLYPTSGPSETVCEVLQCNECVDRNGSACAVCNPGYYKLGVECTDSCPDNYTIAFVEVNGAFQRRCVPPPICFNREDHCHVCSTDAQSCDFCRDGYYLQEGVCIETCPEGTIPIGSGNFRKYCEPLPQCQTRRENSNSHCSTCDPTHTNCTICADSYYLLDGVCVLSCPDGYIENGSGNFNRFCLEEMTDTHTCIPKYNHCHVCTEDFRECEFCRDGFYLHEGICIEDCPEGTTPIGSGNFRRYCSTESSCRIRREDPNSHCGTCDASQINCTVCADGYYLHQGACTISCPTGYSGLGSGNFNRYCELNTDTCTPRQAGCHRCLNINTCEFCREEKYLLDGTCRDACPEGYTEMGSGRFRRFCEAL